MFLFKSKLKEKAELVFDVGSGSVALALVTKKNTNSKPKVLWYEILAVKESPAGDEKRELKKVFLILSKKFFPEIKKFSDYKITDAHIIFSAPWYVSEARKINIAYGSPKIILAEDIAKELQRVADDLDERTKKKTSLARHIFSNDARVVEKVILNTEINGYRIDDPIGKSVKELSMDLFLSVSPKDLCESLSSIILNEIVRCNISIHSFPMAHATVLSLGDEHNDTILIDMSGTTTDITKVSNGSITDSVHLPMGKRDLIRTLSKEMSVDTFLAESLLRLYSSSTLSNREMADIDFILKDTELLWKKLVLETIQKMQTNGYRCSSYILSADDDVVVHLNHSLESILKNDNNELHCATSVKTISNYTEQVDFSLVLKKDPFIALEALYVTSY